MRPLFSPTKTRPSEAKRTTIGFVRPEKTVDSWKPDGKVPAGAVPGITSRTSATTATANAAAPETPRRQAQEWAAAPNVPTFPRSPPEDEGRKSSLGLAKSRDSLGRVDGLVGAVLRGKDRVRDA